MAKEVEMKDVSEEAPKEETPQEASTLADKLSAILKLIEKAVRQKETKALFGKVLRQAQAIRKQLTGQDLRAFLKSVFPAGSPSLELLLEGAAKVTIYHHWQQKTSCYYYFLAARKLSVRCFSTAHSAPSYPAQRACFLFPCPQVDGLDASNGTDASAAPPSSDPLPEVEAFAFLVVLNKLLDSRQPADARSLALSAIDRLSTFNRRTLDALTARIYSCLSLAAERCNALPEVRSRLLALHRTAALRRDEAGQEALLNLLLRSYLHCDLVDQASAQPFLDFFVTNKFF
jgi:26S proteasome regulatory subunit N3